MGPEQKREIYLKKYLLTEVEYTLWVRQLT